MCISINGRMIAGYHQIHQKILYCKTQGSGCFCAPLFIYGLNAGNGAWAGGILGGDEKSVDLIFQKAYIYATKNETFA